MHHRKSIARKVASILHELFSFFTLDFKALPKALIVSHVSHSLRIFLLKYQAIYSQLFDVVYAHLNHNIQANFYQFRILFLEPNSFKYSCSLLLSQLSEFLKRRHQGYHQKDIQVDCAF